MAERAGVVPGLGSVDDWEGLVEELSRDLVASVRMRLYWPHIIRVRGLGPPSEKLVYLYLLLSQPQTFTSIRRALSISRDTVNRALSRLLEAGFVFLDNRYLYWLLEEF
jgi:DNA-binding transcriptional ArsR family regulator